MPSKNSVDSGKSQPKVVEITVSHGAGGSVDIRDYGKEKSTYNVFMSEKLIFDDDWTAEEAEQFALDYRARLRDTIDAIAQAEHEERFNQSYLSGGSGGDYS